MHDTRVDKAERDSVDSLRIFSALIEPITCLPDLVEIRGDQGSALGIEAKLPGRWRSWGKTRNHLHLHTR